MVCKIGFTNWNPKIALLCAFMVFSYCIKLFWTGADRQNCILMSPLLLVQRKNADYNVKIYKIEKKIPDHDK